MIERKNNAGLLESGGGVDRVAVVIYFVLMIMGWLNIYAAVYDDSHASIFDLSQRYGMQAVWVGFCSFLAISILLIDSRFYHIWAVPLYLISLGLLVAVLLFGREVHGAKSWFYIGSFGIQPAEFVKFTAALALARIMSETGFSLHSLRSLLMIGGVILIPVVLILKQNDTGSALVYFSFLFMFYREGFNRWIYIIGFTMLVLFIFSFLFEPALLVVVLLMVTVLFATLSNRLYSVGVRYLAAILLGTLLLYVVIRFFGAYASFYSLLLICIGCSLPMVVVYSYRTRLRRILLLIPVFFLALGFTYAVDYSFNNILQIHQQKRILDLLGIENDMVKWGYNVNQSKIAIGSGGLFGKGFLNGTQTKFNFVPEQSTDFIFCTVGEEWGFIGSAAVVILFGVLIFRLMKMGERQQDTFGRIYCYSVASIFLMHVLVNVGMTIGIMPVIGIPLPFFSYGGSSLISFTILLFVAIRMDSARNESIF